MHQQKTINARGKLIDLSKPLIMGVLNITPDSFFDGGRYSTVESALDQAVLLSQSGAAVLDIGGMSSRPGSTVISASEELERVVPVLQAIRENLPNSIISLDTIHAETAHYALGEGAHMINDISGGRYDENMLNVVGKHAGTPFICMHMQGLPKTMQVRPRYDDVVHEVLQFFVERLSACRKAGIHDVIFDPGFGFGKTLEHNYELLKKLGVFKILEMPILAGLSRKSAVCRVLNIQPTEALNGSTVLHTLALLNGANILRVHDVVEAREAIELIEFYKSAGSSG